MAVKQVCMAVKHTLTISTSHLHVRCTWLFYCNITQWLLGVQHNAIQMGKLPYTVQMEIFHGTKFLRFWSNLKFGYKVITVIERAKNLFAKSWKDIIIENVCSLKISNHTATI